MTSTASRPASILLMSSTSSTSERSTVTECRSSCTSSACCADSSVVRNRSTTPTMPFSGVRISWLMFARNVVFAVLASSARARASWMRFSSVDT